jgi:hypothetical protein
MHMTRNRIFILAATAVLVTISQATPALGQATDLRAIEKDYLANSPRFRRLGYVEDYDDARAMMRRLEAKVDPDDLSGEDLLDFLCLRHLRARAIGAIEDADRSSTDPSVHIPYGDLLERATRGAPKDPVKLRAAAFRNLRRMVIRLRSAPSEWTAPKKDGVARALKRAKLLHQKARTGFRLLLPHLPREERKAWQSLKKDFLDALDGCRKDLARLSKELPDPTAEEKRLERKRKLDLVLEYHYMLDCDSDELLRRGARFFLDTQAELRAQAKRIDPDRTWPEIARRLEEDHPPQGGLVAFAGKATRRAIAFLTKHDLFTLPKEASRIDILPGKPDGPSPFAHYRPARGKRSAAFVAVPCSDAWDAEKRRNHLRANNRHWLTVVAVHEAVPGHHLQFTVARNVRPLRNLLRNTAYVEGWALYCEETMGRVGFYSPGTRLTQLRMKLWRAVRVLASVGMNHRGLSQEGAVRFLVDQVLFERFHAEKEVKNYKSRPHYFVGYAVGYWQLLALRKEAQKQWGARFSDRAFHDTVLAAGPIPIPLLHRALATGRFGPIGPVRR